MEVIIQSWFKLTDEISVELIEKKIKNMHLAVYPPNGNVRLAIPMNTPMEVYLLFAKSKLIWIKKSQKVFENQDRISAREFKQRESHYYLGQRFLLRISEVDKNPRIELSSKQFLDLFVNKNSSPEKRKKIMDNWYRKELYQLLIPLITKWENILGVKISDLKIRKMVRVWGSCNAKKSKILLNLELIKKPKHCIEYVVLHELLHLLVANHGDEYIKLFDLYMPNWRVLKNELNCIPIND